MKILFIYNYEFVEPLGIMHLSSFLKENGHHCDYLDVRFEKDVEREVGRISPDIIAYSITTGRHQFYRSLNQRLKKEFKFFSLFGGPHCTFFPEFIQEEGVDAICIGEGEFAILELADGLAKGRDITKIMNLWLKSNGKIYKNEVRGLIDDLDALPFPDRELINKYKHNKDKHMRFVMTGRGCPYKCTYCFNHSYHKLYQNKGRLIRKRSIGNVIRELKSLKGLYRLKKFQFMDDTFNLDEEWTLGFCSIYKKEINLPFIAILRVNLVNEEIARALKNAGCITVVCGVESGNEHLRNNILKRGISEKQILDAAKLFNKYGLRALLQNIVGLPDETLQMALETLKLNIKCKPAYGWVSIFQPYPRTELCDYSKKRGYYNGDVDSFQESLFYKSVMNIKDKEKLERLHHLFSIGVAFPFLLPLVKILVNLPLERFYLFIWNIHKAWCYLFRVKILDFSEIFMRENSKVKATQALFLTAGTEILASSRTRVYQYLPYLEKEGIGHKVINFASGRQCQANTMKLIRSPLGLVLDKIYNFFQVLKFLFYAKGYDVIFIQKILLPKPLQSALRFLNSHIVFDFDDAIFIKDLYKTDKFSGRFIQMLSQSKYIILENDFTKDFVQKYNKNIMMITGPIDTNRYPLRKQTNNNRGLTIGWIGSQDTLNYLQMLYPVFQTLANKYNDLKIEVIGASKIEIDGINLLVKDWSLDTEVSNLSDFDIGVMPLCDDDWSKGKGGYKLLQYMAIGIPCVASPVGVNQKIIREGINGYLAKTQKEWEEKLSRLIEDQDLRLAMGRNGREIAEREYSFEANIERFIAALKRSQCLSDRR